MNVDKVRLQFPFLERKYNGRPLAYLDNASTTQKPRSVIETIGDIYKNHYANIHRGVYDLSMEATELYEKTRVRVAELISAKSEKEIIFTRNTTESINLLAYTLSESLKDGDEILLTQMEHHSNIVPWQMLKQRLELRGQSLVIKYIPLNKEGRLELSKLEQLVTKRTRIISLTLMSNVLGTVNPINKIALVVRRLAPNAALIVDVAQAVGHIKVDVSDLGCDFLAFSVHKMYGPCGVGVLYGKEKLLESMSPFLTGGHMILSVGFEKTKFNDLPWKFEAGTANIADVIAFEKALDFLEDLGIENIQKHDRKLTRYVLDKLIKDSLIQVYGPRGSENRGPVVSFNIKGLHPHDVASILSEEGVAIRSGHHCAQPLMGVLGIDYACRVSFGVYNTEEEIDRFIEGIGKVKKVFRINQKSEARNPKQVQKKSKSECSKSF